MIKKERRAERCLCERGMKAIVDAAHFDFHPSSGSVLLDDVLMERLHKLGVHVGEALLAKEAEKAYAYQGYPGIYPDCHGTIIVKRRPQWNADQIPRCLHRCQLYVPYACMGVFDLRNILLTFYKYINIIYMFF